MTNITDRKTNNKTKNTKIIEINSIIWEIAKIITSL